MIRKGKGWKGEGSKGKKINGKGWKRKVKKGKGKEWERDGMVKKGERKVERRKENERVRGK